jgi:hypothetical protein
MEKNGEKLDSVLEDIIRVLFLSSQPVSLTNYWVLAEIATVDDFSLKAMLPCQCLLGAFEGLETGVRGLEG